MKVRKLNLMALTLLAGVSALVLVSCLPGTDPLETRCEQLYDEFDADVTAFGNNPSEATCEEMKESAIEYADDCAGYQYYNQNLVQLWRDVDCSVYNY